MVLPVTEPGFLDRFGPALAAKLLWADSGPKLPGPGIFRTGLSPSTRPQRADLLFDHQN